MGTSASRSLAAIVAATLVLAGCGGGSGEARRATRRRSIKSGFVKPADLGGKGMIAFEDTGVAGHIIYTPEDSVPTCPYVQRADDAPVDAMTPAVELQGGNSTGRFIVGPQNPRAARRRSSRRARWCSTTPSSPTPG